MDSHDARTCVIFGAGDYYDETPAIPDDAFVVAADGGLDHVRAFGIDTDFVVGDFDSITGGCGRTRRPCGAGRAKRPLNACGTCM